MNEKERFYFETLTSVYFSNRREILIKQGIPPGRLATNKDVFLVWRDFLASFVARRVTNREIAERLGMAETVIGTERRKFGLKKPPVATTCKSKRKSYSEILRDVKAGRIESSGTRVCVTCGSSFPYYKELRSKQETCPTWVNPKCLHLARSRSRSSDGPKKVEKLFAAAGLPFDENYQHNYCKQGGVWCAKRNECLDEAATKGTPVFLLYLLSRATCYTRS